MDFSASNVNNSINGTQADPFPFLMDHLPEAFCKKAEIELKETIEAKFESLINLREMIKGEETLEGIHFHNDFLQQFLRGSKHDVKKALDVLKNFVFNTRNNPFFEPITAADTFEKVKQSEIMKFLPQRTPEGCVIVFLKYDTWNPKEISLNEINRYAVMIIQQCLRDQMTQINGMICIFDWKNMPYRYFRHFTPSYLHDFVHAYLKCFPIRYKLMHSVNHPAPIKIVWSILRNLLPEKIRKRVTFHSNPEGLMEYFPANLIPIKYGGLLREELYETKMSNWLTEAFEYQKNCPLGGQTNCY